MTAEHEETAPRNARPDEAAWYCVRTRPKTEHLVAGRLRRLPCDDVFCPRIRYRKPTRRGPVWFTEALFPCYVFARFPLAERGAQVRYLPGARGLVQFGHRAARLPDGIVEALRAQLGDGEEKVFDEPVRPGEEARVVEGPFSGITAVVTRVLPARERVRVLLHFLGRPTEIDVPLHALARTRKPQALPREGEAK